LDALVRVPQDSDGKAIDASLLNVNGVDVLRQRIVQGDPNDPLGLVSVKNTPPLATDFGSVVRPLEPSCLTFLLLSAASNNASVVKGTTGVVYAYDMYNQVGYPIFVKLYDKATAPDPAADAALLRRIIPIQAGSRAFFALKRGLGGFASGIGLAITLHAAVNDNTPVALGDCITNLDYL
jgi:hypothetical protein